MSTADHRASGTADPAPASAGAAHDLGAAEAPMGTEVRASTAERNDVDEALQRALGEGRLSLEEASERMAAASAATYRSQLTPLLADLPDEGGPSLRAAQQAPAWADLWRAFVWRLRLLVYREDAATPPTPAQCRIAVRFAVAALMWLLVCALAGAVAVGA